MPLTPTSVAAAVAASADNVQFKAVATNVDRKILIIGAGTAAAAVAGTYTPDTPTRVYSADDVGTKAGFGSETYLTAEGVFEGNNNACEVYAAIQDESATGVAADGTITYAGNATADGKIYLYLMGKPYEVAVTSGDAFGDVALETKAVIDADPNAPATTAVLAGAVTFTAKTLGTHGNDISITLNWGATEDLPAGITAIIVDMAGGANDPDAQDVLDVIGSGDLANAEFYTDWVCAYGRLVTATLDIFSNYNGRDNLVEGCWGDTVHRPFRVFWGDCDPLTAAYDALVVITTARKAVDRTNGVIAVPGSPMHPQSIAGLACGECARINQTRAQDHYIGTTLKGVIPGTKSDQWTKDYSVRDSGAKVGISPTRVIDGVVKLQNVLTFYHPSSVPIASNGYRSMRNISIMQNVLHNVYNRFETAKWQGISIVADVAKVSNVTDRAKARDLNDVRAELFALAGDFEKKAWIFSAAFTRDLISAGGIYAVTIRAGGLGFDNKLPILLSGEGGIFNTAVQFDTSLAVVTA
jgi:phage tail sheath gpL-like